MLLTSTDGASVELRPTGYQHPAPPPVPAHADDWDANWLQVYGAVRTAEGQQWTFDQPCLTTWEARELLAWMRAAAQGAVVVTAAPTEGSEGVLAFTEPNLAFSIAARGGEHLVVRVHLGHESAPGYPWPDAWDENSPPRASYTLRLPLRMDRQDLLAAAGQWRGDLTAFPHRPSSPA